MYKTFGELSWVDTHVFPRASNQEACERHSCCTDTRFVPFQVHPVKHTRGTSNRIDDTSARRPSSFSFWETTVVGWEVLSITVGDICIS